MDKAKEREENVEVTKKKKAEDEKSAAQYDRMLNVVGEKIRQIV